MDERYHAGDGVRYVVKTRLQLAKEATDRALQNLKAASDQLSKAQDEYRDAQKAESPCLCQPTQCTTCGGKK